jgi:YD repeat-containing protein
MSAQTVSLPTKATRGSDIYEWTYDQYGNKTSEKDNGEQTLLQEFLKLPNGEFALVKQETPDIRYYATYDSKGMLLSEKTQARDPDGDGMDDWGIYSQSETVVNANGVRTGVKEMNWETGELELSDKYTFDNKGRVLQDKDRHFTYTWGDALNELKAVEQDEIIFSNITFVKNTEYFDPYSLEPLTVNKSAIGDYAWQDYHLHEVFYNTDIDYNGTLGAYSCTIDEAAGEYTRVLTLGGQEMQRYVLTKLPNGGFSSLSVDNMDGYSYVDSREYDEHGALIMEYSLQKVIEDGSIGFEDEDVYAREYDAQGRPTKTVKSVNGEIEYEEIYTEWTTANPTSVETVAEVGAVITVYAGHLSIATDKAGQAQVYSIAGQLVAAKAIPAGATTQLPLPKGLYIVSFGGKAVKVFVP